MNDKIRLYSDDSKLTVVFRWLNRIAALSCWIALILNIVFIMKTGNFGLGIVFGMYTPIRYFLFDIAPEKIQRRPPSLDRSIPLTIFVRYLRIVFPIPQGNVLATIVGFILASARAAINGYALLFFDTFTFFFEIRDNKGKGGFSSNDGSEEDTILHSNKAFDRLEKEINESDEGSNREERLEKLKEEWYKSRIANNLNIWDFPIRRYLNKPTYYFENKEVGNNAIDAKYILEDNFSEKTKKNKKKTTKFVKLNDLLK